jgi:error-prone DNA polymerase
LRRHPLAFLRSTLASEGVVPCEALARLKPGRRVTVAGLVTVRQRPGTARGIIFATIEDETDIANLVVFPDVFERFRRATLGAVLLRATGRLEREGLVIHVLVERLDDLTDRLRSLRRAAVAQVPAPLAATRAHEPALGPVSRDFH